MSRLRFLMLLTLLMSAWTFGCGGDAALGGGTLTGDPEDPSDTSIAERATNPHQNDFGTFAYNLAATLCDKMTECGSNSAPLNDCIAGVSQIPTLPAAIGIPEAPDLNAVSAAISTDQMEISWEDLGNCLATIRETRCHNHDLRALANADQQTYDASLAHLVAGSEGCATTVSWLPEIN